MAERSVCCCRRTLCNGALTPHVLRVRLQTFRGFFGTKFGLNCLKGRLPKPLRLHHLQQPSEVQSLQAALSSRDTSCGRAAVDAQGEGGRERQGKVDATTSGGSRGLTVTPRVKGSNFLAALFVPAPRVRTFKELVAAQ